MVGAKTRTGLSVALPVAIVLSGCTPTEEGLPDTDSCDTSSTLPTDMLFLEIVPGEFTMGSPLQDSHTGDDQWAVTLTRGFLLSETEVTRWQFESQTGYQPSLADCCGPDCPVDSVTWHMAASFTNAMSESQGLDLCYQCEGDGDQVDCEARGNPYDCGGYRLPTEAEWEFAARAGSTGAFYDDGDFLESWDLSECGDEVVLDNGIVLGDICRYCQNDDGGPGGVFEKAANSWGLYGVHGNVAEWCHDWWSAYGGDGLDPYGTDSADYRVARGGGYSTTPLGTTSFYRWPYPPESRPDSLGFRVARTVP